VSALDTSPPPAPDAALEDRVVIETPAMPRYVAVIRLTAAAMTSRLGFTLDSVEDLKLAVDEAVSLAIESASPGSKVTVSFVVTDGALYVSARAPAASAPNEDSYAWGVLVALSDNARCRFEDGVAEVSFEIPPRTDES
jgi:serine/threonine-protein kinase RsbW